MGSGAEPAATQRRLGRFESANGGTIFLDEVGDLPPEIQIALLRVLQEREIERVGSSKPIPVDVRVLAATHRDLNARVAEGKFRPDLEAYGWPGNVRELQNVIERAVILSDGDTFLWTRPGSSVSRPKSLVQELH